ncbi:LOW QUALITY PROTEIN: pleckstrin homology-like domain family A member 1 [Cariama cristata]
MTCFLAAKITPAGSGGVGGGAGVAQPPDPREGAGPGRAVPPGFPGRCAREEPPFPRGVTLGWRKPLRFLRAGALPALRLGAGAGRRVIGWCRLPPEPSPCGRRPPAPPAGASRMLESGCKAVKEGVLEKRSDGLLQLWKKKRCILTEEGLLLIPPKQQPPQQQQQQPPPEPAAKIKELHFSNMKTVDCVERKGKYVYFTVVMAEGKEIDFRCAQEQGWNAAITLQMVQYKNRQAILAVRSTRQKQQHLGQPHGPRLRAASNSA